MSPPDRRHVVGIDLGTSTSCVAAVVDGEPRVLPDPSGQEIIPSVVAFPPQGPALVGEAAQPYLVTHPESVFYSFKRILGRRWDDPGVRTAQAGLPYRVLEAEGGGVAVEVRGRPTAVAEIAALVLSHLKRGAEARLGAPVDRAVIAVPATWNDAQRAATRIAGRMAGLDVIGIINEPTAAALAFGFDRREARVLCIYDFGGGTFDFTVLELEGQVVRALAVAGDPFLGGDDLDRAIAYAAAEAFKVQTGRHLWREASEWQRLLFACEAAKRRLSDEPTTLVRVPRAAHTASGPKDLAFPLDRRTLRRICGELVDRTFDLARSALDEVSMGPADVDAVSLVGGTTYVRMVRAGVARFFSVRPEVGVDPVRAVALGAAIQAAALAGLPVAEPKRQVLLEVTSHALGVVTGGAFHVVIEPNEPLPAEEVRAFTTSRDGQTEIRLSVFQGDPSAPDRGGVLGEVVIDGLPPAPSGRVVVDVTFRVDAENRVSLSAVERDGGRTVRCHLGVDRAEGAVDDEPSVDELLQEFVKG